MSLRALIIGLIPALCHSQSRPESLRKLPPPFETVRDSKQYNAVRLGPGNAIAITETPPDFRLAAITISPDGHYLATAWASGRIELWDIVSKRRASEFRSGIGAPQHLRFSSTGDQLIVTASGGKIVFLDPASGRKLRGWTIPLGQRKYDIQEVVLAPDGRWLAYADEESSKVIDLTAVAPRVLADLNNAYSLALSQDGTELWTVNRNRMQAFSTATWQQLGQWPLKTEPVTTSPVVIRAGMGRDGQPSIAVPSSKGLVIYRKPEMQGEFVTDKATSLVEFAKATSIYVDLSGNLTLVNAEGRALCKMAYAGSYRRAISEDGQWLAFAQFDSVDLWRMDDLLRDCAASLEKH